jgi:hypothetical protein
MGPGRELDALVAEKVMGISRRSLELIPEELKPYSTDIGAAWDVVEHVRMKLEFYHFSFHTGDEFEVEFSRLDGRFLQGEDTIAMGRAKTAPLAICLAALKAVGWSP